jgi:mannose/cellobiose epimerase-like protein (N-acyl-D-glucosamine 2-epimerase family)
VQARQIYVYSHAATLGLYDGRLLAARAFERMIRDFWQASEGGFIFRADRYGRPIDTTRTAYDQAFALLAAGWLYRITGEDACIGWAHRTLRFMDEHLADRAHAGYADSVGAATRCQNPHMHLFEALIVLFEATGNESFLARADVLHDMFRAHFFDRDIGALREFFDEGWRPAANGRGDLIDPGHQFEWVWLLRQYRRYRPGASEEIEHLFAFGRRHGIDPKDGLVMDEVTAAGQVQRGTKRLWPQTEHLKALVVRAETDNTATLAEIERVAGLILRHYLVWDVGTWRDQMDADGAPIAAPAPASSFYHLFLAFTEAVRAARTMIPA